MYSQTVPSTAPHSQALKLPGQFGERFVVGRNDLIKEVARAVLPFHFQISPMQEGVQITGDEVAVMLASRILQRISEALPEIGTADAPLLKEIISSAVQNTLKRDLTFRLEGLRQAVQPMSLSQVAFMQTLLSKGGQLILGIGPTGTGKTHLAIAAALHKLSIGHVKHIVITRPHVVMEGEIVTQASRNELESDDQFEFFEDILRDLIGYQEFNRLISQRMLELTPLGHMRGRTFNDTFIIVDEAQNMTIRKMRMAVTRIGQGSRMVVTGNPDQIDLRGEETSGLVNLLGLVQGTDVASVHHFEKNQIIRTNIVAQLEELYARQNADNAAFAA